MNDELEQYRSAGVASYAAGQFEAAADSFRRALALDAGNAGLHHGLCEALRAIGQFDEAAAHGRRAVELDASQPAYYIGLGAAQHGLCDLPAAADSFRKVLELEREHFVGRLNLADTLRHMKRFDEALACYRIATGLDPAHFYARANMAVTLQQLGQFSEAVDSYQLALAIRPDDFAVQRDLAAALQHLGRHREALAIRRHLLDVAPHDAQGHLDIGQSFHALGLASDAIASLRRAVEIDPGDISSHSYLAYVLMEQGERDASLESYRRALALDPASAASFSNVLFTLSHCSADAAALFAEHRQFGEQFESPHRGRIQPHANDRDPERVINVGFVSADLHSHAVATFIEPIFALLAQSPQLSLHAYYNNFIEDDTTRRLRGYLAHWHPVATLDDEALDRKIRADGIDVLFDLSGHSASNRLPLFARKPAPVQASWIGYAGTTGLEAMDYYISDGFHLPEGRYDDQFTEKIVRLPLSAPFTVAPNAPPVNALPALANGYLTFGSFNRANKLSREVIALWAKLLHALPDSKMLLGGLHAGADTAVLDWFAAEGIDTARLTLHPRSSLHDYLMLHHQVDICLASFPYTGSTTICHALWMGVPTLTTVGPTNPSHSSVCYLAHLGLSSFVANDEDTYVRLATFLSENLGELAALRESMRERFNSSVVGHPLVAAAGIERAIRIMWRRWCAGQPAAPIRVTLDELMNNPDEEGGA